MKTAPPEEANTPTPRWVSLSKEHKDREGRPMLRIGGALYPMAEARAIAYDIREALADFDFELLGLPVAPVPIASGHINPKDNPLRALSVPEEIK